MVKKSEKQFSGKELPVLITVDVCDGSFDQEERKSRFGDLMELMPDIRDIIGEVIGGRTRGRLPVTWFVRADMQVKDITGNAMGLFRGWRDFWDGVEESGGETAWHPHLYKRNGRRWVPIRDPKRLRSAAEKIWHELSGAEWNPVTSRMGESVGSNELMQFLDTIGIKTDSSALPGRVRDDGQRWFDWENTPDTPYHPARGDYRRSSRAHGTSDRVKSEEPLSLLEIPFTMAEIVAPYDSEKSSGTQIRRYIDLSFDCEILRNGIGGSLKNSDYLMLVVHPMQAAGLEIPEGGLVVGGAATMRKNLEMILNTIERSGRIPGIMTIKDFAADQLGEIQDETVEKDIPAEREERDTKTKGGTQRTLVEKKKAVRLTTKGGVKAGRIDRIKLPRRGPGRRRG